MISRHECLIYTMPYINPPPSLCSYQFLPHKMPSRHTFTSRLLTILYYVLYPFLHILGAILTHYNFGQLHPSDWATEYSSFFLTRHALRPVAPLPRQRPRQLSIVSSASNENVGVSPQQQTISQQQSMFFAKLPAEIRVNIYGMALSGEGKALHIVRSSKFCFSHVRCTKDVGDECQDYECFTYWTPDPKKPKKKQGTFHGTHGGLLELLLTCRRM